MPNGFKHRICTLQDVVVPKTKYGKPLLLEPCIAFCVRLAFQMLATVSLDNHAGVKVDKIHDIRANGLLPAKLLAGQAVSAQVPP